MLDFIANKMDFFSQLPLLGLLGCITSFLVAVWLESMLIPRVLLISKRKRLYDIPDKRKSHKIPIPRLAGITFFPVVMLSFLPILGVQALFYDDPSVIYSTSSIMCLYFVLSGCIVLVLLGIKDDLIGVRYSHKFAVQILSALLLIASGTYVNNLQGLLGIYEIPDYVGLPLTIVLIVYIINSINLIDGVDGLAAVLISIATLSLGCSLLFDGKATYASLAFSIAGMLLPFIYFNNSNRRKIFMGDTGSLTLGYLVAFLTIHYSMSVVDTDNVYQADSIIVAWSVLFIPLFDTARVICVRASQRKPLFHPDRNHIHHKLLDLGYSHKRVTATLALCALFILVFNILLKGGVNINLLLVIDLFIGILFNVYLNWLRQKKIHEAFNAKTSLKNCTNNVINA